MPKVTEDNLFIAHKLDIEFEPSEFKLDEWGNVDFYYKKDNLLVLLEVEKSQKHPNTNVAKVWPYLEENPKIKVLLIQIIREENRAPRNRIALCDFLGQKMENVFPDRFRFIKSNWADNKANEINKSITSKMEELA